jgi:hypothetical protein
MIWIPTQRVAVISVVAILVVVRWWSYHITLDAELDDTLHVLNITGVSPPVVVSKGENGIAVHVWNLLMRPGVFVEMGAKDGVTSNSIWLEKLHGWSGLCIEASPANFAQLTVNRPKCNNVMR